MEKQQQITGKHHSKQGRIILLCFLLGTISFSACNKHSITGAASLTVFNGVTGSSLMVPNFSGNTPIIWYRNASKLYYGGTSNPSPWVVNNNYRFNSYSGDQRVAFFEYPDTLAHDKPILDLQLNLPVSGINTLFLTGTLSAPDTVFIREQLPYRGKTDSTTGFRVINLVKGFTATVNLQGKSVGSEVPSLGYKTFSPFKNYEVKKDPMEYVFEIRDANTGTIVSTQTINTGDRDIGFGVANLYRFRNFTIIIYGELNNTGLLSSAIMGNY